MTTIATDGKIIVADSLACFGSERKPKAVTKIHRKHNRIYAVSGFEALVQPLIEWHNDGHKIDVVPKPPQNEFWSMFVWDPINGPSYFFSDVPYPSSVAYPLAIGAGADHAMGAMWAGASPKRAVEICIEHLTHTGGPVQVEVLSLKTVLEAAE